MRSRCLKGLANPRWKAGLTVSEREVSRNVTKLEGVLMCLTFLHKTSGRCLEKSYKGNNRCCSLYKLKILETSSPLGPRFLPSSGRDRMKVLGDYPPDMIPVVEGGWRIPPRIKVYGDDRFLSWYIDIQYPRKWSLQYQWLVSNQQCCRICSPTCLPWMESG